MKKLLILALLFLIVNIQAQNDISNELFDIETGESSVSLTPKGQVNPFKGKKEGRYDYPSNDWFSVGVNRILKSSFTEKQIQELSNSKIIMYAFGNASGEIKYATFWVSKEGLSKFSQEDLHRFYQQIIKMKDPEGKISIEPRDAEFFALRILIRLNE